MASNKENPRAPRVSMPILPSSNSSKNLGDTLSPRKLARRSLAPRKSILKFVNGPEDLIQDTDTADNTVQLSGDDRRKSLARRVSFAAHAQVRLYNKEAKTDNTSSPASAPQGSTPSDDSSKSNPSGGRKSSISSRRRSSAGQRRSISSNWEEEDSAMDIEEDEVTGIPPIYVAEHARHLYERSPAPSEDDDDEEDMEMTNVFGNGIVAAHTAPDDQSDTSVTQQPNTDVLEPDPPSPTHSTTTDRSEPMEFTVALEQSILPSRRASLANEAWAGLQALQHSHGGGGVQTSPTNDINLADAMARMIAASPSNSNSQFATYREEDDSIFSDHSFREDQTMDFTSVVQSHLETPERSLINPSHNPFLMDVPREEPALRVSQESIPSTQSSDPDAARPLPLNISVMSQPNPPTEPLVPRSESSPPRPISQNIPTFASRLSTSTTNGPPIASPKRGSLFNSISIRRSSQNGTSSAPLNASTTTPTTPPGSPKRSSLGKRAASPLKSPTSKKQVIGQDASKRKSVVVAAVPEEEVVTESESDSPEPADQSPEEPTQVTPTEPATQEPVVQEPTPQEPPSVVENPPPRRASSSFALRRAKKSSIGNLARVSEGPEDARVTQEQEVLPEGDAPAPESNGTEINGNGTGPHWDEYQQSVRYEQSEMELDKPKISVVEFLDMAGIHFHDNMPVQRRQTLGPDVMTMSNGSLGPIPTEGTEFALAEYYRAEAVDLALLDIYSWATTEIKRQMTEHKQELALLEEEIEENPPAAVLDFLEADDDVRPQIETAFKLAKAYAKRTTRSEWYRWKAQWTKDLQPQVEAEIQNLESHIAFVKEQREKLKDPMEELRKQHVALKAELDKERTAVAEIEACDPEQLEGLKAGISEQNVAIDGFKSDIAQATAELERVKLQLEEQEAELREAQDVIASAKRQGEVLGTTRDDVLNHRMTFEGLQELHRWKLVKVSSEALELHHKCKLRLMIPMANWKPVTNKVEVQRLSPDVILSPEFPQLTDVAIDCVLASMGSARVEHAAEIVQRVDAILGSLDQVLAELRLLQVKFPIKVVPSPDTGNLNIVVTMLIRPSTQPSLKSKVLVTFTFDKDMLGSWPASVNKIGVKAQVVYGSVNSNDIVSSITDRISLSNPNEHYGTLLDACGEAVNRYE